MFTGVWSWAELWRYDHDGDHWSSMGRAFTHPELTDKQVHPYQEHADRFKLVSNHWGQRITGMTARQKTLPVCPSKYKFTRHENMIPRPCFL